MANPSHIPHLLKLLDDESDNVQKAIALELSSFGPHLRQEIQKQSLSLSAHQKRILDKIFIEFKKNDLKKDWPNWFEEKDALLKLERPLELVSRYLNEFDFNIPLGRILDDLAAQYKERFIFADARLLARFLFHDKGLKGNDTDYYSPQNSNLYYVLSHKCGIPLSLSVLFMLVGQRLGLAIEGCNYPGHFLARVRLKERFIFIDCFSGGQMIEAKDIFKSQKNEEGIMNLLYEEVPAESIVRRYLINLVRAFETKSKIDSDHHKAGGEDWLEQSRFMITLLKEMDLFQADQKIRHLMPEQIIQERKPVFSVGDVIKHKKYAYQGIIVDIDSQCKASDNWYYGSSVQPDRDQPWLHILVHGTDQVTYVGECDVILGSGLKAIHHPLLNYFFKPLKNQKYLRNDNPWPETDF